MKQNTIRPGVIFDAFLLAEGKFVSGNFIATSLEVSRVSIWARLQRLKQQGFEFEGIPRIGYKLIGTPKVAHAGWLAAWLRLFGRRSTNPVPDIPVHVLPEVDSTNDEAGRLLGTSENTPFAVVATKQTAGRGRRGRTWQSTDGGNLYLSFAIRPLFTPDNIQSITLAVGLALCEALSEHCKIPLQIKWPNDLLCGGRKVAGILAEARMDADLVRDIVFGVGLNVNGTLENFPDDLRQSANTLAAAAGHDFDINEIAALCIATIAKTFDDFLQQQQRPADFDERWARYDSLNGKTVTASGGGLEITGTVLGLDPSGALRVRDASGTEHALNAGEVTLSRTNLGNDDAR